MSKKSASEADKEKVFVLRALTDDVLFEDIYEYYYPKIYNYVRLCVTNASNAEDITSQIFIKAFSKLGYYAPEKGEFSSWFFTIATNTIKYYFRLQKRCVSYPNEAIEEMSVTREPDPNERISKKETKEQLLEALRQLSKRDQIIISLKFWAGLDNRKIAQLLKLTENNVAVLPIGVPYSLCCAS